MSADGVVMHCGHAANGKLKDGSPVCAICYGIVPGATVVQDSGEVAARVAGRMMRCGYKKGRDGKPCAARTSPVPSNPRAAFFRSLPEEEFDEFYCGCWGWD